MKQFGLAVAALGTFLSLAAGCSSSDPGGSAAAPTVPASDADFSGSPTVVDNTLLVKGWTFERSSEISVRAGGPGAMTLEPFGALTKLTVDYLAGSCNKSPTLRLDPLDPARISATVIPGPDILPPGVDCDAAGRQWSFSVTLDTPPDEVSVGALRVDGWDYVHEN